MTRILVVEDELPVQRGLRDLLKAKGYDVLTAETGPEGLTKALDGAPELVLLDVMLPGKSGYDILRELRAAGSATAVVMLTAKGAEIDKVLAFQLGVDDYVTKPFSILELLGRIEAVLRRSQPVAPPCVALGALEIDLAAGEVRRDGYRVDLSHRAYALLAALAKSPGQVFSRDRLIDEIWGRDQVANPRSVDNLVVRIRQAIETDPDKPRHLLTAHGAGYRLVP